MWLHDDVVEIFTSRTYAGVSHASSGESSFWKHVTEAVLGSRLVKQRRCSRLTSCRKNSSLGARKASREKYKIVQRSVARETYPLLIPTLLCAPLPFFAVIHRETRHLNPSLASRHAGALLKWTAVYNIHEWQHYFGNGAENTSLATCVLFPLNGDIFLRTEKPCVIQSFYVSMFVAYHVIIINI